MNVRTVLNYIARFKHIAYIILATVPARAVKIIYRRILGIAQHDIISVICVCTVVINDEMHSHIIHAEFFCQLISGLRRIPGYRLGKSILHLR